MPKCKDISSVLIIGAGPIVIGQACEFDYSGTQACKALKEEGLRVILINSNPATIMTDPEIADATYIEPITLDSIEKILIKEKPDALLSTVGGQTALNCGLELYKKGILEKHNVLMIGARPEAIEKAEDRHLFNKAMQRIGLEVPKSAIVSSLKEGLQELKNIGLPAIIRPSFTLGGSGGGIAYNLEEFKKILSYGLDLSPTNQVLINESILGWKEYEMEVVRDHNNTAIIICSIENIDPMGVHTGDSITVAPALTLTDKEYQEMRSASIAVLREIGVETGGSNVQFAINPRNGKMFVIEMNPRVSRSSALASKVTGFPIAKVAAKLAIGYRLDEIQNDITQVTPICFEPSIDYVVTKIPRFNFEKFDNSEPVLSTSMRSVGEVMAIGRNFKESLQKGLCSLETGLTGLNTPLIHGLKKAQTKKEKQVLLKKSLKILAPDRILRVAEGFRVGLNPDEIYKITGIDPWFLKQIEDIVHTEKKIQNNGLPKAPIELLRLKKMGFSDVRLSELAHKSHDEILNLRCHLNIRPVFKRVDTCAGEFESQAAYLYSCYEGDGVSVPECESFPSNRKKVIILGSGPNRIGQGIEFDYTCVHAAKSLSAINLETIMINCNPETVSTDYDTSDKLYFEPLSPEYVLEAIYREQQKGQLLGVIVQFGGQTPLKLAKDLQKNQIPILGTSPDSIDLAENRERLQKLLVKLGIIQPQNSVCHQIKDIAFTIKKIGYPVVVRPSNVLGGRSMAILRGSQCLEKYLKENQNMILDGPILIDRFLKNAIEVDVDAIYDGDKIYIAGIMEHIEHAGVHSGDSACVLPPWSLSKSLQIEIVKTTEILAKVLKIKGFINVQYAIYNEKLYMIEVNPRASRTTPFVAKATGVPIVAIASQVMVGKKLINFQLPCSLPQHFSFKEVVLPFSRFTHTDILLGPEMKSTGETMGWDKQFLLAFAKAQLAAFNSVPTKGFVLICYSKSQKDKALFAVHKLINLGFKVGVIGELAHDLQKQIKNVINLEKLILSKVQAKDLSHLNPLHFLDFLQSQKINFAIITDNHFRLKNLRRGIMLSRISYFSTHELASLAIDFIEMSQNKNYFISKDWNIKPIQSITL